MNPEHLPAPQSPRFVLIDLPPFFSQKVYLLDTPWPPRMMVGDVMVDQAEGRLLIRDQALARMTFTCVNGEATYQIIGHNDADRCLDVLFMEGWSEPAPDGVWPPEWREGRGHGDVQSVR